MGYSTDLRLCHDGAFTSPLPPLAPRQRQELESENKKLKHNLAEMRQSLLRDGSASSAAPGSPAYKVLLEQLNSSCEELDVRKEEVLILRSQLVSQKEAMHHKVEQQRRCLSACGMALHTGQWCGHVLPSFLEVGCKMGIVHRLLASTFTHPWRCCRCRFFFFHLSCLSVGTVSQRVKKYEAVALFSTFGSNRWQSILLCFTLYFISVLCLIYCLHLLPCTHVVPQDEKVQLKELQRCACSLLTQVCVVLVCKTPSCKNFDVLELYLSQQP